MSLNADPSGYRSYDPARPNGVAFGGWIFYNWRTRWLRQLKLTLDQSALSARSVPLPKASLTEATA